MSDNHELRFVFTNARLRGLPPAAAGKRVTYYDEKKPGLCLRITDRGAKSFIIYRKFSGLPKRKLIGSFPQLSVEQARKVLDQEIGKLAQGVDIFAEDEAERGEPTLGELFAEYINRHASKKRKTSTVMQQNFNRTLSVWAKRKPRTSPSMTWSDSTENWPETEAHIQPTEHCNSCAPSSTRL